MTIVISHVPRDDRTRKPTAALKYITGTGHGRGAPRTFRQYRAANMYHNSTLTVENAMDTGL
ncbi:MAG: hypothetical protein DIU82_09310 [Bacillota bacterium]|nr:MAG: hypothetical protein DIU82_09310 [Bacillota bacterium]